MQQSLVMILVLDVRQRVYGCFEMFYLVLVSSRIQVSFFSSRKYSLNGVVIQIQVTRVPEIYSD